ncbi:DUF2062 domain-containing protein [Terasakiella sp.]|uniref:DUF2062 domain-containing protein n=1 Tax=Terasakiella sp. TaxID=2034861 RepID=UPI003AA99621
MFRRRNKPSILQRISGFFWPSIGWKRSSKYVGHRVARLPGTPYSIAAGFACGAAISFTPFVGLHLAGGALFAWLMRGNLLASWIGTLVGNPWTFPFIWVGIYRLGLWMGAGDVHAANDLDFISFFEHLMTAVKSLNLAYIGEIAWPVLWPMFIGGLPSFVVVWILFFFPIKIMVQRYHARRVKKHAIAQKSTFKGHSHDDQ